MRLMRGDLQGQRLLLHIWMFTRHMLPASIDHRSSNMSHTGALYPIFDFLSINQLSDSYKHFVGSISNIVEPKTYKQVFKDENWLKAMETEISALERTNTWTLVPFSLNKHCIDCKWVYRVNYKSYGNIERHKARLLAKGYT